MLSLSLDDRIRTLKSREIPNNLNVLNHHSLAWKNRSDQDAQQQHWFLRQHLKLADPAHLRENRSVPPGI
jgi:hypothetical protein